ncbi:MAG: glycosyltransferase [Xanthomonadales bacterium]|nr:glycosyltransferase family 2 protein [Gammaproteobacteria bacterium]MBT8051021.1 glycosyltransferase family 2 protein [Gammaproteobacteria bacterium]NNJ78215.1 glycosyltransferase [Xanthomonadales bacterium]NNL05119.1 glycosyltransferase [Xanthomonadales bacterium]
MVEERPAPRVSVVIPAYNAGEDLDRCLAAVMRSDYPAEEVIVVDDASTEASTAEIASRHGATLLRMARQSGPGLARNRGAEAARGEVLMFTDADVLLHADAIGRAVETLVAEPGVAAVFGSYDDRPTHPSFLSRYRNLYHHWNHQVANDEASTFWTGCGAIRRNVFLEHQGFSCEFGRPSIEDIELGYRLRANGHRIRLQKDMLGTHLKEWTFGDMVKTDVMRRGAPWVALLLRHPGSPPDLNLNLAARIATAFAGLFVLFLLLMVPGLPWSLPFWPWVLVPMSAVGAIAWIQRDFLGLLRRRFGPWAAAGALPLQLLFFICCGLAVPLGYLRHWAWRRRQRSD